jgi:molybdopterin-containing oxidoreductase family iron-sulfur binding subunit
MWRSLAEYDGQERFQERLLRQHPRQSQKVFDPPERRDFLKLMGASLALAGVSASCTKQPQEKLVPWAKNPEQLLPGKPLFFATSMPWAGGSIGLLVESHMGRPTRCDGNADHPASLGATDVWSQAAVLGLYDPDRSQCMLYRGRATSWSAFLDAMKAALTEQVTKQGAGLRILSQAVVSPTLEAQLKDVLAKYPKAAWHQWQPHNRDNARAGALLAFGKDVALLPRFDKADVVVSLEADFLSSTPANVRAIRDFTSRRKLRGGKADGLNRLYVAEGRPSCTGAAADHRLTLRPSEIEGAARALAAHLHVDGGTPAPAGAAFARWAEAAAKDLGAHKGRALVVAGEAQPPAVHALANLINEKLDALGSCVQCLPPAELSGTDNAQSLRTLVQEMKDGKVELLVLLSGNPVYDAPADLEFGVGLSKVPLRVHLSLYQDETSEHVDWHVNEAHFLEAWSDARGADGTLGIVQPLIAPLYNGRSVHELLAVLLDKPGVSAYDTLREHTKKRLGEADFEKKWRRAVHDGIVAGSASEALSVSGQKFSQAPGQAPIGLEVVFRTDPLVHDGRFANNGWLLEQPRPMTMLTWDNAVQISPATAARLGVETGDVVEVAVRRPQADRPGLPDARPRRGVADADAGIRPPQGRAHGQRRRLRRLRAAHEQRAGPGLGRDAHAHGRDLGARDHAGTRRDGHEPPGEPARGALAGARRDRGPLPREPAPRREARRARGHHALPRAQEGRVRLGHGDRPQRLHRLRRLRHRLLGREQHPGRGQVGGAARPRDALAAHRPLLQGDPGNPKIYTQPIPCMQCENAPCESVCPVAATTHSPEGLNDMVYNRCIGTRYCANNCPYKVRRFNFFLYSDYDSESLKMARNPDVSVRSRGVMEKCTYCVQRINRARLSAKKEDRRIRDGEIRTACQSVCPADAIAFGDLQDPESAVSRLKAEPQNYALLEELNTRPRTTYLARITNPNRELEA